MTTAPGIGVTSFQRNQGSPRKGLWATLNGGKANPMLNPSLVQTGKAVFGGSIGDGTYTLTITDAITGVAVAISVVRASTPATNAALATEMAAAINASEDLNNVVNAEVDGSTAEQVNLTWLHAGRVYTVVATEDTTGTFVWTQTQAAGGSARNLARFVRYGAAIEGHKVAADLAATSLAADVVGFVLRPRAEIANQGSTLASDEDQWPVGSVLDGAYEGKVTCENAGDVAAADNGLVYVVRDTTGGDSLGEARATPDGVQHVVDVDPTEVNDTRYQIQVSLIDESTGETVTVANAEFLGDSAATATEISTAYKADLDTLPIVTTFGATVALAGTGDDKTAQITAPLGYRLIVDSIGDGANTIADSVAFAMYTIKLPRHAAHWDEAVAAGGTGRVALRLPA